MPPKPSVRRLAVSSFFNSCSRPDFGNLDQAQLDDILAEENRQDEADAFELHELQTEYPSGSSGSFHSHYPSLLSRI